MIRPAAPYRQRDLWLSFASVVVGTMLWQGLLLAGASLTLSGAVVHRIPAAYASLLNWLVLGLCVGGEILNLAVLIWLIRRARPAVAHGIWVGVVVLGLLFVLLLKFILALQDYAQTLRD